MPIRPPVLHLAKTLGIALLLIAITAFAVVTHSWASAGIFVVGMAGWIAYVVRR